MSNPFLVPFTSPYEVPPFDVIKDRHFIPAIKLGMKEQKKEIKNIISNAVTPDFENTVLALEYSGQIIRRTTSVLYNVSYANTSASLQQIMQQLAPSLSAHSDHIFMNAALFKRVKYIWENQKSLHLKGENLKLLELYYKAFVRNGANLNVKEKKIVADINQQLSLLSLRFGKNILDTINEYKLIITEKSDLAGLTEDIIASAADTASWSGHDGKWIFTLQNASVIPFLQYSDQRHLRQTIWEAYTNKGNNGDEFDNNKIVSEIVKLRAEKANILGYDSHAHYILEEQMAKSPDQVYDLLNKLWGPAIKVAQAEADELQQMIRLESHDFKLKPWDWRYYAEKLRKQKYDLDEMEMKPYFSLGMVQQGVFDTAQKLYGVTFTEVINLPVYHPDAKAYEVSQNGNKKIGILYLDFFPRDSKQGGAWMTSYVTQCKTGKKRTLPVISIVCNFTKPVGDTPSLLTFDEVNTFFHEFGHALHGLLSDVTYQSLAGTNVPTDFVELPSQILENWCAERDVLKTYAFHYKTGATMPDDLITKMDKSSKYGQGFATVEYLAACMLDMGFHTLKDGNMDDIQKFESETFHKIDLLEEIIPRYRSTYFSHIFAGGYSAGYYSYIWSEVLDADAFSVFKAKGLFDKVTADSFRKNILEMGGSADPMKLYVKFRGNKPGIEPLLEKRGLVG
jgi:peptidyl-dipeptidase Dcp